MTYGRVPISDKIRARARELLLRERRPGDDWSDRPRLRQIVNGKVQTVDVKWWRHENGVAHDQIARKAEKAFAKKLAALEAMADPRRNPSAHERLAAEAALAKVLAAGPPKPRMPSAPGLEEYDREEALARREMERARARMQEMFRAAAARWEAAAEPVNTTKPKPRSADRHLEPNRDRHSPGYMREYMKRRRAAQKQRPI